MNNNHVLLRLSLAAVWLLTAWAAWLYPQEQSIAMIERTGLHGNAAIFALYAGIALDGTLGVLTLINLRARQKWFWLTQGIVIIAYSFLIAVFLPEYTLHPFGMLIKNLPMLAILWILWHESNHPKGVDHV